MGSRVRVAHSSKFLLKPMKERLERPVSSLSGPCQPLQCVALCWDLGYRVSYCFYAVFSHNSYYYSHSSCCDYDFLLLLVLF